MNWQKKPCQCKYTTGDKPCCVIGQLMVIEQIDIDLIKEADQSWTRVTDLDLKKAFKKLKKYPEGLLKDLQDIWDTAPTSKDGKKEMLKILEDYK